MSDDAERAAATSTEHERVGLLRALFASGPNDAGGAVELAIGDDAAILRAPAGLLVWSIDAQVEEQHFRRSWMSLEDIGYRATMAALSDLAAMGARSLGVLAGLVLPSSMSDEDLVRVASGQREAATEMATQVVGGNMTRGDVLSITTTVLGVAERPLRRDGCAAGDEVWLAGHLGRAAAALALRLRGAEPTTEAERACDRDFRRPRARLDDGSRAASDGASAMIDVSDGLAADLGHMARASNAAIVLDAASLDDPFVAELAPRIGRDPRSLALEGGEDYALVATARPGVSLAGFRRIGSVTSDDAPGVYLDDAGRRRPVVTRGFDHFAKR